MILYATKIWQGEYPDAFSRHREADLVIANNMKTKIIDIGDTDDYYFTPELEAVTVASNKGFEYILWYASDVIPPTTDWVKDALPLLKTYPIVSPFWEDEFDDYVRMAERQGRGAFQKTGFGFADQFFSDQAYIARVETMKGIDYNAQHEIARFYPDHGGNSFERRVAQWLASTNQKRAVLKNHRYRHISRENK